MERQGTRQKAFIHSRAILPATCAALLLAISPYALSQQVVKPADKGGTDAAGAVIVPPVTDPGMSKQAPPLADTPAVKPPPANMDPDAVRGAQPKPGASETVGKTKDKPAKHQPRRRSGAGTYDPRPKESVAKDNCKGSSDLCKQDSAR